MNAVFEIVSFNIFSFKFKKNSVKRHNSRTKCAPNIINDILFKKDRAKFLEVFQIKLNEVNQ